MIFNQRLLLAIWLSFHLSNCVASTDKNDTRSTDQILSEKEAKNLINDKLEQLSLAVHRKEEGDRIRKKRQFDLSYLSPGDQDEFASISLRTIVSEIEPLEPAKQRELFKDASSWSTIENLSNITLFWTKKQRLNPYNSGYDRTFLNYATLNPDLKKLNLHYSAPDLIQHPSSLAIKSKQFNYYNQFFVVLYLVGNRFEIVTYRFEQPTGPSNHPLMIRTQSLSFTNEQIDFDLIQYQGNVYLAVSVNQRTQGEVRLYKWNRIQFDLIADQKSETLAGVDSLKLFKMSGTVYIATSTISKDKTAFLFSYQGNGKIYDSLRLVQKMNLDNGVDDQLKNGQLPISKMESFSVHGNHYLVFIGPYDCRIFWWLKSQFIEFQRIPNTAFAKDLDISYLPSNEAIISLITYSNDLKFYTESVNGEFVSTFSRRFQPKNQLIKTASLVPFRKTHYFVFLTFVRSSYSTKEDYYPIYHLNLTAVRSFKERRDPLMNCLDRLNHHMKRSENAIENLKQRTTDVWVRNRDQVIRAPIYIHDRTEVRSPTTIRFMDIKSSGQITNNIRAVNILNNMKRLEQVIGHHQKEVDTNVVLKGPVNQSIQGPVSILTSISGNNVNVDEIANSNMKLRINNVSLYDLTYKTLRKTGRQIVVAPYTFANNVTVNSLNVKSMNGLNLNDVLLTQSRTPQNVSGRYEFNNLHINDNVQLQETINQINLNQLARLNSAQQQVQNITGDKVFNVLDFKAGVQVSGLVNGGDVQNLAQNAIKLNAKQPQVCLGKLVFLRNVVASKLDVNRPINDRVELDEMLKYGLRKDAKQTIQGNVKLNSLVTVNGDLKVDGLVNNLNIESDLLNLHHSQMFNGELVFQRPITMLNNFNAFMINSVNFTNEIVYRNSPVVQFVISHKTFDQDLFINNNLTMKDATTIDYVDPSELVRHSLSNVKRMFGSVTFDNLRVLGSIQTNRLNDIQIKDLTTKYWIKNYRQVIDVPVVVNSPVRIQRLSVERLNNHLFPSDYVVNRPNTEQLITASKVFVNTAVLNGSFITSTNTKVNGLNLNRLDTRVVQNLQLINKRDNSTIPDFIGGYKKFQTLEVEGNLYVNRINDMRIEDDVLLRNSAREQVIVAKKTFVNTTFVNVKGSVEVGDSLFVRKAINKINLNDWSQDVVLKGTPEIVSRFVENKQFLNRVDTRELNLFGQLSGVNFTNLISRAVYLDNRTSDINVPIIFNEPVQFDRVRLLGRLNNYDLPIYERSLVYKRASLNQRNQPLIITGKTSILGALTIESNLKSANPLTTVDLGNLQSRMLSKSRLNVIRAPFVFEQVLKANQFNLANPNAKINNVNPNDFVRLDANITLPGRLVIEDALDIVNSLNVQTGSINQFNVNELYRNAVNRFGNVYLGGNYGDVIFKYLDVKGNLHTKDKLLDDIHLENEYRNKVIDANNVIETPLIFTDAVSVGNLIVRNRINGVRFDHIIKDAVLKSVPQTINSSKVFIQDVVPRDAFTVHHLFNITGLLNRARLDVLNRILLRRTIGFHLDIISPKYFNKPVYFERDLQVAGRINRLRIPADLVLSQKNEFVNTTAIFKQPVEFIGQLDLLGTYNGYPIRASLVDRIDSNKHNLEHNPIRSALTFNDKAIIGELVVLKSINGIPIHFLIPANTNRTSSGNLLKGKFVFDGNLRIEGDLIVRSNVLNKVNLVNLATQTVRINSNDYLPGRVIVDRRFTFNRTQLNRKLNGIDLRRFRNYYLEKKSSQENYFRSTMSNLDRKDQRLGKQVDGAFGKLAYLEYFENYDEFDPLDANGKELIFDRFLTTPFVLDNQFDGDYIMQPTIEHLTAWRIVNRKKRNTKSANSYCDHYETWSYTLNEYDDLVLQEEKIVHRAFPAFKLTFKNDSYSGGQEDDENTFYLWSNTTGCHLRVNPYERYSRENIPFEVTLLYTSQFSEIGKMKRRISEPHTHKGANKSAIGRLDGVSAVMEDARFFTDKNNRHYAFVAFSYSKVLADSRVNSTLFEFSQKKNKWSVRQQLLSEGAVAVDMVHYYPPNSMQWYEERTQNQRITLLAIANRLTKYDQSRKNVIKSTVYAFDDTSRQLKAIAQLPTYSPKSVLFVPIYKRLTYANSSIVRQTEHDELFLIYANEKLRYYDECSTQEDLTLERSGSSRSSLFNQGVSIYRIAKTNLTFTLHQQLDIVGSITLDKFYLPSNQAYIVIGSKILHKTFVYYFDRSTNQFVLVQTISTPSVENVKVFWSKSSHLYLAIASSKSGASKRLKAVINGPNPFYLRNIFLESK